MADRGGRFPIGWVIVGPPALALGYYLVLWLIYGVLGRPGSFAPAAPVLWFYFQVFVPLAEWASVDSGSYNQLVQDALLCVLWTGAFLLLGLVLGALAGLANGIVHRGGTGGEDR